MALCVLAGVAALGAVALNGNARLRATSHRLHEVGSLAALDNATWAYLLAFKGDLEAYVSADDPAQRTQIGELIDERVALIDERLRRMHRRYADGSDGARLTFAQEQPYLELRRIWKSWAARPVRHGIDDSRAKARALAAIRTHGLLMADTGEASSRGDERVAEEAEAVARRQFHETRFRLLAALVALGIAGIALVAWFGRSVVPAIERERAERRDAEDQAQLHAELSAAIDEQEAAAVLAGHIERQVGGSSAVLVAPAEGRDALEVIAPRAPDERLAARVASARVRDCLAMRHGAPQVTTPGDLLPECGVCPKLSGSTVCQPLLCGDEATGSLRVTLDRPIRERERRLVQDSVTQAAPVIVKLRDLADARSRASTDSLTGTPNRRSFQDAVQRMAAQASRSVEPLAAVILDLDHFKAINDTFGHTAGDLVLRFVGASLKDSVRAGDFVARLGGEEFALLLPATGRDGALVLAETVRRAISELEVPGVNRRLTASLGVAVIPDDAGDGDGVVARADEALYAAKAAGRNCVVAAADTVRDASAAAGA